mmetsp:Transcript_143349/g.399612  ORF Transcript_143349/g.399612 Transcript_143349/m.399612 type:complete len:303 (-) Transcript_143349:534-1442(-)
MAAATGDCAEVARPFVGLCARGSSAVVLQEEAPDDCRECEKYFPTSLPAAVEAFDEPELKRERRSPLAAPTAFDPPGLPCRSPCKGRKSCRRTRCRRWASYCGHSWQKAQAGPFWQPLVWKKAQGLQRARPWCREPGQGKGGLFSWRARPIAASCSSSGADAGAASAPSAAGGLAGVGVSATARCCSGSGGCSPASGCTNGNWRPKSSRAHHQLSTSAACAIVVAKPLIGAKLRAMALASGELLGSWQGICSECGATRRGDGDGSAHRNQGEAWTCAGSQGGESRASTSRAVEALCSGMGGA